MRTNEEIRNEAWTKLWREKWFWRILSASILLDLSMQLIFKIICIVASSCIGDISILSQTNLSTSLAMVARGDMSNLPTITLHIAITAFMTIIATGITQFGKSAVLLRAADGKEEGYLKAAFEGLKMPLGLAYLTLRVAFVFILWGFLALLPFFFAAIVCSILVTPENATLNTLITVLCYTIASSLFLAIIVIPFYRYRFLFRIKADNPEWSAGKCMRECSSLTQGNKWRIFKHDCSYWKDFLAPVILGSILCAYLLYKHHTLHLSPSEGDVSDPKFIIGFLCVLALYIAIIIFTVIAIFYLSLGQTILYREIRSEKTNAEF